ncbi:unnamed protein product [Owenia fusiformis]|uniref:Uncharacterized protein n=1 Tax=Owenia fusiformis TaxID=6347 RepID=A0A8J1UU97_OWEFU|nr:unnamed protein product [Owenia fusiformis]
MNKLAKHWRDAATVILAARAPAVQKTSHGPWTQNYDFRLLMLKRSSKSKFMPSAYVFPGGMASEADFSNEWCDVFNTDLQKLGRDLEPLSGPRPPMFTTQSEDQPSGSIVPNELAFRLCAIRETFEESGVLLAKSKNHTAPKKDGSVIDGSHSNELTIWRKKVDADASNFILMCKELQIVPDVWAMMEWSNWLTPTAAKKLGLNAGRRYETAFFLCCVDHLPITTHDEKETVKFGWLTPDEVYEDFKNEKLWIAPPQVYELARIANFSKYDDLLKFSKERATEGCEQIMPVISMCTDGRLSLYPGDDLYPSNPDYIGDRDPPLIIDSTIEESRGQAKNLNRMEFLGLNQVSISHNIVPSCGHIAPAKTDTTEDVVPHASL